MNHVCDYFGLSHWHDSGTNNKSPQSEMSERYSMFIIVIAQSTSWFKIEIAYNCHLHMMNESRRTKQQMPSTQITFTFILRTEWDRVPLTADHMLYFHANDWNSSWKKMQHDNFEKMRCGCMCFSLLLHSRSTWSWTEIQHITACTRFLAPQER